MMNLMKWMCVAMLGAVSVARATDAVATFDKVFSARLQAVRKTIDLNDDIDLARQMIIAARQTMDQPNLVGMLCDHAYELSSIDPKGFRQAVEAMGLLADTIPARRLDAYEKQARLLTRLLRTTSAEERIVVKGLLVEVLTNLGDGFAAATEYANAQKQYLRARSLVDRDDLEAVEVLELKSKEAGHRERAGRQIARLQEKVLNDANDHTSAEELIRLYLVDMDDPMTAVKYATRAEDTILKDVAVAASKPVSRLTEDEAFALGMWYADNASIAPEGIKTSLLRHAECFLNHYVKLHGQDDVLGKSVTIRLAEIRKRYAESEPIRSHPLIALPHDVIHTWGKTGIPRYFTINRVAPPDSFQTHPTKGQPAHIRFEMKQGYVTMHGGVGVKDRDEDPASDLTFRIVGDGKKLWRSKPVRRKGVIQMFRVSVEKIKKVELFVECGQSDSYCSAVWVVPVVYNREPPLHKERTYFGVPIDSNAK